jgi:hypothetical protein
MLSQESLGRLIEEFTMPRPEFGGKSYVTRRREWFDKPIELIKPLLAKENLNSLDLGSAQKIYDEISVGGPKVYPKVFIENGMPKIRQALHYLLYGPDDVATRFYNFAGNPESEHRLNGVGREFTSTALFLLDRNQYGIWNSAVDGGLKLLEALPDKGPGSTLGQQYVEIVSALKELQARCKLEDLSLVDEFVELVCHGKIGAALFKPPAREPEPDVEEEAAEEQEAVLESHAEDSGHLKIQYWLVKIGLLRQYDAWIASNDRNRTYAGESLANLSLSEFPVFADAATLRVARAIDVIWFKKHSDEPVCFFEVEDTPSMYSGLIRLNDVKTDYPMTRAFVVAPAENRPLFDSQIRRPTFIWSGLADVCQFMSYDAVEKLITSYEAIADILP